MSEFKPNESQIRSMFEGFLEANKGKVDAEFQELLDSNILKVPMYRKNLSKKNLVALAALNLTPEQLNSLTDFSNFEKDKEEDKNFYKNILKRTPFPNFSLFNEKIQSGLIGVADSNTLKKILDSTSKLKAELIDHILTKKSLDKSVIDLIYNKLQNIPDNYMLSNDSLLKLLENAKDDKEKLMQILRLQAINRKLTNEQKANIVSDIFCKLAERATETTELAEILRLSLQNTHLKQTQKANIVNKISENRKFDIAGLKAKLQLTEKTELARLMVNRNKLMQLADILEDKDIDNSEKIALATAIIQNTACPLDDKMAAKILDKPQLVHALDTKELEKLVSFAYKATDFQNILSAPKVNVTIVDSIIARTANKQPGGVMSLSRKGKICSIEDIGQDIIGLHNKKEHNFQLKNLLPANIRKLIGVKSLSGAKEQQLIMDAFKEKAAKPEPPAKPPEPERKASPTASRPPKAVPPGTESPEFSRNKWLESKSLQKYAKARAEGFDFFASSAPEKRAATFIECL